MNDELDIIWKEAVVAQLGYYRGIILQGLAENHEKVH
jgi:hypothetical protein